MKDLTVCGQHDCSRPSLVTYIWPGRGKLGICGRHVSWMIQVSRALGMDLEIEVLEIDMSDEKHMCLFQWELDSMREYSCSVPSGVVIGKKWKRNSLAFAPYTRERHVIDTERALQGRGPVAEWFVGEYVECAEPGRVGINWYKVLFLEGPMQSGWQAPDWDQYERWKTERAEARAASTSL